MENTVDRPAPLLPRSRTAVSRYLADIAKYPLLSKDEEAAIALRDRGALVLSNLRFVVKIAAGYNGRGLSMDDLISEGNLGLIRAAERFDPKRGTRFITYAAYWIRKALCQALSEKVSPVRLPRYQMMKARRLKSEDPEAVSDRPTLILTSLDDPASSSGDRTRADILTDDRAEDPEERAVRLDLLGKMEALLDRLDERERAVIVDRFGLSGSQQRTLKQVGTAFGLSRERIRQIEHEACGKMREQLESMSYPPERRKSRGKARKHCNPFVRPGS